VKAALEGVAGVSKVEMRFKDGCFDVTYDPSKAKPEALTAAVQAKGPWKASIGG
jgi:copper chaperone CopZ